jgi:Uma2 family endonuclease
MRTIDDERPNLDDEKPYTEYLAGRPVQKVSPKRRHGKVQGALFNVLTRVASGRGEVSLEWRCRIDDAPKSKTHLVPDVAFVSYERWRPLGEQQREELPFAPDIAVEVRSPGDDLANFAWKIRAYLDNGALAALDVLPLQRRIVAHTNEGVFEFGAAETFAIDSVPWLRFEIEEAFVGLDDD